MNPTSPSKNYKPKLWYIFLSSHSPYPNKPPNDPIPLNVIIYVFIKKYEENLRSATEDEIRGTCDNGQEAVPIMKILVKNGYS